MTVDAATKISALRDHIANTNIKVYTPEDSGYDEIGRCFISRPIQTVAIARPQTAEDVSMLVRFCTGNGLELCVRSGGHDVDGRTKAPGTLVIDMRDINHVSIDEDKSTARVGGGTLLGKVAKNLGAEGLVTPTGTIATVGYAGWAMLGGYGPFSPSYGLGVDQIVGAKVVKANGDIIDADDELLFGLRGAGGTLGVVVELQIKVYPVGKLLFSTLVYESSDLEGAMTRFNSYYEDLLAKNEIPGTLNVQPALLEFPGLGMVYAVLATWTGDNEVEGREWIKKLAASQTCVMEATEALPLAQYLENNERLVEYPSYGRCYTASLKRLTPKTIATFAEYAKKSPGGGLAFSVHTLRHDRPSETSAFTSRKAHHMIEIIALSGNPAEEEARGKWATALVEELKKQEPDNIVSPTYISLGGDKDTNLETVYGCHYEKVLGLKKKYDSDNVFKYAVPRLLPLA